MDDSEEMRVVSPEDVAWQRVAFIQVKRYDVSRRMELVGGPIKSMPLLGSVQRYGVEVIHKDDTWDWVHWVDSPVEAHRLAHELAAAHGLIVRVVP